MKIFVLHGWAYDTKKWSFFLDLLKDQGFDVELLKIPGLSQKTKEPLTIDDYVNWLQDVLPKEPSFLLGHSNGGRIAMNFALDYPERVSRLILIDSAGVWHGGFTQVKRVVLRHLSSVIKHIPGIDLIKGKLYKLIRASDYHKAPDHMKITLQNVINSDKHLEIHELAAPTAIIWGAEDRITPLSDGVKLHSIIKGSTFEVIDHARHSPMFTHPEQTLEAVLSSIKQ